MQPDVTRSREAQPAPPPLSSAIPQAIASRLHTLALLAILVLTTSFGTSRATHAVPTSHLLRYATSILLEWLLLAAVLAGIRDRRAFLRMAFRNRARTLAETLGFGIVTYLLGFMSIALVSAALLLTPLAHQRNVDYILALLPRTPVEFVLWFALSLTAGICEELIFRGYLLQQITAWTRKPSLAIFLAALLFGSVHLYEGLGAILPLATLALLYGFVVRALKGDLRAVILAHTLQDFLVALLGLARPWLERTQHLH